MALAEADMGATSLAMQGQGNRFAGDETLLIQFFTNLVRNEVESSKEGRPIYNEVVYIRIRAPGEKDALACRPVSDLDRRRFSKYWEDYNKGNTDTHLMGTPLSAWPAMEANIIKELEYFNVFTVEQLAGMTDIAAQKFRGMNNLREKAKAFIALAKDTAVLDKMNDVIAEKDNEIATLNSAVEDMATRLAALESKKK